MSVHGSKALQYSVHASDAIGGAAAKSSAHNPGPNSASRITNTKKSTESASLSLAETLLRHAPGIALLLDSEGVVAGSSACARSCWPRLDVQGSKLADVVDAPLASEWTQFVRTVARNHTPLAIRGVVKGEWLWLILTPLSTGTSGVQVLATLRAMSQESIHTPPAGVDPSTQVVDAMSHDLGTIGTLSKREIEVLSLVGVGLTTGQIAKSLHRSLKTVENHRTAIGRKLNARSLLDICRIARRAGMPESTPIFAERAHGKGESSHLDGVDGVDGMMDGK